MAGEVIDFRPGTDVQAAESPEAKGAIHLEGLVGGVRGVSTVDPATRLSP